MVGAQILLLCGHVLGYQGGVQVEVADVKTKEFSIRHLNQTLKVQFDGGEISSLGGDFSRVFDSVFTNGVS